MSRPAYLIVKLGALGDVVMASTLVGSIRNRHPDAHVTWLCGSRVHELVSLFDGVDDVVAIDELSLFAGGGGARVAAVIAIWRRLAGRRFDVTVLTQRDWRYRLLLASARSGRVVHLRPEETGTRNPIPGRYYGDEFARLLDVDPVVGGPRVGHAPLAALRAVTAEAASDPSAVGVVLVPGGAKNVLRESALRRWPVDSYAELARALIAHGHGVTLVGDANDGWVRPAFAGLAVRDELGGRSIAGTIAMLRRASLVITHDTGPLHLARLARAPLLALFGPTMPTQFLASGSRELAMWGGADLACRPCYDGREFARCTNNLCMQGLTVPHVLEKALVMLSAPEADRTP
ncbi:MAG: glycosyltransferase family 9 protein [Gemmatimonadaceae bacterium]|nr:glycosyltransferase family 9 protein [Gemmatimonadaceae bacterium]